AETILKILGLDLSDNEAAVKDFKEQRLDSTRKLESLKSKRVVVEQALPENIQEYAEPVLLTELLQEKTLLEVDVNRNRASKQKADYLAEKIEDTQKKISELQDSLKTLDKDYAIHQAIVKE